MTDRLFGSASDERSVSEVIGYILIFSLILTSVTLISIGGTNSLEDVRDREQASNAERAIDVVAENMAAIYERNSPSRATEVDLSGSQLYYGDEITVNVTTENSVGDRTTSERDIRPIVLRTSDQETIVYEAGATFRTQSDGGSTLRRAPFVLTENRVHTPIVQTTAEDVEGASGTTILLRGQAEDRAVLDSDRDDNIGRVYLNITSPRYELWADQLEQFSAVEECDTEDGTVVCEVDVNDPTVYVTAHEIELSIVL